MKGLGKILGATVLAACTSRPATGVKCGTEIRNGHVEVVGSKEVCEEVSGSIGPRAAQVLINGEFPDHVPVAEEDEK